MSERFVKTTTLRRPRVLMLWTVAGLMLAFFVVSVVFRARFGADGTALEQVPWWLVAPLLAAIQRRPKIQRAAVEASAEGLRIGDELLPRAKLASALLRREHERAWVTLRGRSPLRASVDVEVADEAEADRLCRALALDAASTTVEFTLFRAAPMSRRQRAFLLLGVFLGTVALMSALAAAAPALALAVVFAPMLTLVLAIPLVAVQSRVKLLVGADGLVVREGLGRRTFVSHEEVAGASASGASVVVDRKRGGELRYSVGGSEKHRTDAAEFERRAQSVAWRIDKALEAYCALAGEAPQAALVLDRGGLSARAWLEQLRRIGAGANATFRSASLTRDQLLRIVESTTAAAKARLAAAAALHDGLTEEERPRIRVAAERCAEPALAERMVRVAFAPSDDALEAALDEESELSGAARGAS